VNQVW